MGSTAKRLVRLQALADGSIQVLRWKLRTNAVYHFDGSSPMPSWISCSDPDVIPEEFVEMGD